jgi:hypothetical protein
MSVLTVFRKLLPPRIFSDIFKHNPQIKGHFQLETREGGKLRQRTEGFNIWTLTGREYIAELVALQARSPRTTFRDDRIAYIGMGSGAQAEVSSIESLVDPVVYKTAEYLAALDTPATFPTSGTATTNTAVRFVREFSQGEISLGYNVVLTEAGLFTDGDPNDDWNNPGSDPVHVTPTDFATAAGRAPMAYKTYEPITKTTDFTLRAIWDLRIV